MPRALAKEGLILQKVNLRLIKGETAGTECGLSGHLWDIEGRDRWGPSSFPWRPLRGALVSTKSFEWWGRKIPQQPRLGLCKGETEPWLPDGSFEGGAKKSPRTPVGYSLRHSPRQQPWFSIRLSTHRPGHEGLTAFLPRLLWEEAVLEANLDLTLQVGPPKAQGSNCWKVWLSRDRGPCGHEDGLGTLTA